MLKRKNHRLRLIMALLVIPVASADAERGFSIVNHAKYDRRARLKHAAMDAIIRVRINGPSVENFNAHEYATYWVDTLGRWMSDTTRQSSGAAVMREQAETDTEDEDLIEVLETEDRQSTSSSSSQLF